MSAVVFFESLPPAIQAIGEHQLKRMARKGRFPMYARLTPRSPIFFSCDEVEAWIAGKLAKLTPAADSPPARPSHVLIESFDGEPDDPRGGVTP